MNYLDVGLPHTEYFPKRTNFSPPRSIPMSGLSRKYMGLEPVTRHELNATVNRLCQPKKTPRVESAAKDTGRFVGQKRMSISQISRMVDRLYSRRATKDTLGDDEVENDITVKSAKDRENRMLRNESTSQWRKVPLKPSTKSATEEIRLVDRNDNNIKHTFERSKTELPNAPKEKQDIEVKRASIGRDSDPPFHDTSLTKDKTTQLATRQDSVTTQPAATLDNRDPQKYSSVVSTSVQKNADVSKGSKSELSVAKESSKLDLSKSPRASFDKSETIKLERVDKVWADVSVGSINRELRILRSAKSASRASRKRKRKLPRQEDVRPSTSKSDTRQRGPAPCDEVLINRVASINKSPRPDQSWT